MRERYDPNAAMGKGEAERPALSEWKFTGKKKLLRETLIQFINWNHNQKELGVGKKAKVVSLLFFFLTMDRIFFSLCERQGHKIFGVRRSSVDSLVQVWFLIFPQAFPFCCVLMLSTPFLS